MKDQKKLERAIEALKELLIHSMRYYYLVPNFHRKTSEEYYEEEIKTLELLTGKNWKDIKNEK